MGYVKQHYGDPETMVLKPEHPNVAAYFNLDSGIGRIRGIGLQGNELARPFFEAVLKSWEYLGVSVVTVRNVGNEDHIPFDSVGLPVFPFVQDPLDYSRRIHTNLDVFEGVIEEDMQQAAAVVASIAYHASMRDEKLPRKPVPAPVKLR